MKFFRQIPDAMAEVVHGVMFERKALQLIGKTDQEDRGVL